MYNVYLETCLIPNYKYIIYKNCVYRNLMHWLLFNLLPDVDVPPEIPTLTSSFLLSAYCIWVILSITHHGFAIRRLRIPRRISKANSPAQQLEHLFLGPCCIVFPGAHLLSWPQQGLLEPTVFFAVSAWCQ